jgi:prepilin-type N-terminal cleavage/methylation domain-containing protein
MYTVLAGGQPSASKQRGFTLIEVLVAMTLVTVTVIGVMGGIQSIGRADAKARTADLLQRLAKEKMGELGSVIDLTSADDHGDFTDQGHSDCTWTVTIQPSGATNIDRVDVTATRGEENQTLSELMFVRPTTTGATTGNGP